MESFVPLMQALNCEMVLTVAILIVAMNLLLEGTRKLLSKGPYHARYDVKASKFVAYGPREFSPSKCTAQEILEESIRVGSTIHSCADCVSSQFAISSAGLLLGYGVRIEDYLVCPGHVLSSASEPEIVLHGPTGRRLVTTKNFSYSGFTDVVVMDVGSDSMGLSKARVLPLSSMVYGRLHCNKVVSGRKVVTGGKTSVGFLQPGKAMGTVIYTGSTERGCSGGLYFVGEKPVAMHLAGGHVNFGVNLSFLAACLVRRESSMDYLFNNLEVIDDWEYSPTNPDEVVVRMRDGRHVFFDREDATVDQMEELQDLKSERAYVRDYAGKKKRARKVVPESLSVQEAKEQGLVFEEADDEAEVEDDSFLELHAEVVRRRLENKDREEAAYRHLLEQEQVLLEQQRSLEVDNTDLLEKVKELVSQKNKVSAELQSLHTKMAERKTAVKEGTAMEERRKLALELEAQRERKKAAAVKVSSPFATTKGKKRSQAERLKAQKAKAVAQRANLEDQVRALQEQLTASRAPSQPDVPSPSGN